MPLTILGGKAAPRRMVRAASGGRSRLPVSPASATAQGGTGEKLAEAVAGCIVLVIGALVITEAEGTSESERRAAWPFAT
jgi:hypothetical protein